MKSVVLMSMLLAAFACGAWADLPATRPADEAAELDAMMRQAAGSPGEPTVEEEQDDLVALLLKQFKADDRPIMQRIIDGMVASAIRLDRLDAGERTRGVQREIAGELDGLIATLRELETPRRWQAGNGPYRPRRVRLIPFTMEAGLLRVVQFEINAETAECGARASAGPLDTEAVALLDRLADRQEELRSVAQTWRDDVARGRTAPGSR